jgi:leucyl aminopeptidase
MPFPELSRSDAPVTETTADAVVLALPPLEEATAALEPWPGLAEALGAVGFTGKAGSYARVHVPGATTRPFAVVGTGAAPDAVAVRAAVGTALRTLTGFETVAVAAPAAPGAWAAVAEGAALGGYRFEGYKTGERPRRAARVIVHAVEADDAGIRRAAAAAGAVALVKDLAATPADRLGPADLAERAAEAVAALPVEVTVLDESALADGGYGGILGVGIGSDRPPRLVRLDYAPEGATRHIALVGKGITFDTGGLSLKPAASMVGMKYDMTGAATALAVLRAAAELALPVHVTAWLCVADNMPSGRATRPGDVLRMLDGTTVEALNTDAEGRLVLADGLVAASREHPDLVVDVATLTGAISVALGTRHAGVLGDDAAVAEYLAAAGRAGEDAWRLPLPPHMEEDLDSPIADLVNAKVGDPAGGSLFAALFLRRFVGRVSDEDGAPRLPWVHLDIAGVGWNKGAAYGFTDKGPTGATVRSLLELIAEAGR